MEQLDAFLKPIIDALSLIFFAFFGGIIRTIYRPASRKVSAYLVSILISIPIGVLAANISMDAGISANWAKAIAVVAGIVAHDLIEWVFWTVDRLKLERENIWQFFWRKLVKERQNEKP